MLLLLLAQLATLSGTAGSPPAAGADEIRPGPSIVETRVYRIRQTVTLHDVPADAKEVRMWVPVPADGAWQRVLDRRVVEAPEGWALAKQPACDAEMVVATTEAGGARGEVKVVVETTVMRQAPRFDIGAAGSGALQPELFANELAQDANLMAVDAEVSALAGKACGSEKDLRRKVVKLLDAVADVADHYSKDPTKPSCGRGAAEDCLEFGGGCCTDLHSLFIAAARSQGIPARMQYGYRLNPAKEGQEYDPSYRCWVEFWLPGAGWVPTDLVVADAGESEARKDWYGALDARRVWLWQGRALELTPRQNGDPIDTLSAGWAEIDGVAVDVLPAHDGTPSKLRRTITFEELTAAK